MSARIHFLHPPRSAAIVLFALAITPVLGSGRWAVAQNLGGPRLPIPEVAKQQEAEKLVREVYEKEFAAAKKPPEKLFLAGTLLKQAHDSRNDPDGQYVLLRISRELALAAGDVPATMKAIDLLASSFEVDRLKERMSDLAKLSEGAATNVAVNQAAAEATLSMVEELAANDDYEGSLKLALFALEAAKKTRDVKLIKQVTDRGRELTLRQKEYADVVAARQILQAAPTDPQANLVLGRWQFLSKNDAAGASPYFALSKDEGLKAAAMKEMLLPTEGTAQLELGDTWWDLAQAANEEPWKNALLGRAAYWYGQSLWKLTGLQKTKAEKRIAEARPAEKFPEATLNKPVVPPSTKTPEKPKPVKPVPVRPVPKKPSS